MDCIHQAEDRGKWRAVLNIQDPYSAGNFLASLRTQFYRKGLSTARSYAHECHKTAPFTKSVLREEVIVPRHSVTPHTYVTDRQVRNAQKYLRPPQNNQTVIFAYALQSSSRITQHDRQLFFSRYAHREWKRKRKKPLPGSIMTSLADGLSLHCSFPLWEQPVCGTCNSE